METLLSRIFLISVVPGIISVFILNKKGQDDIKLFALGFLLSYLGVVIAIFIPTNHKKIRAEKNKIVEERRKKIGMIRGEMKSCQSCREIVDIDSVRCKYCGNYI